MYYNELVPEAHRIQELARQGKIGVIDADGTTRPFRDRPPINQPHDHIVIVEKPNSRSYTYYGDWHIQVEAFPPIGSPQTSTFHNFVEINS